MKVAANKVRHGLAHAGSVLSGGHSSWAAVETLVSSFCVAALLVSWADISHALIDVCKRQQFINIREHVSYSRKIMHLEMKSKNMYLFTHILTFENRKGELTDQCSDVQQAGIRDGKYSGRYPEYWGTDVGTGRRWIPGTHPHLEHKVGTYVPIRPHV